MSEKTIIAYKGFDADWKCRGFQFEVGKTYAHDGEVSLCNFGFHACERPLDVLTYYPPTGKLAVVELAGVSDETEDGDSKRVGESITVKAALDIVGLVRATIAYTMGRCDPVKTKHSTGVQSVSSATGDQSASSATGDWSASSATGNWSASSATGYQSASSATGNRSASSATGYRSVSSATGYQSVSSVSGDRSASSASGVQSASSAIGVQSVSSASGVQSMSSASGDQSVSSAIGDQSVSSATGDNAIAAAFGMESTAMAGETGIVIVAWRDGKRKRLTVGYVGEDGVEADIPYRCDKAGKLVRA